MVTFKQKKTDVKVDYPKKGLEIPLQDGSTATYDLYGVVKHYGDNDSGHYIATTLDPVDQNWYNYNDDNVTGPLLNDNEIVSKNAYVLFYRKRGKPDEVTVTNDE